jgi:L-threonylcarbamoyladenylate synthase
MSLDHPAKINEPTIQNAIDRLATGECIGLPTETVYGLAANATHGEAVAKIFQMKGRPQFNPLIAHVSDIAMAEVHGVFDNVSRSLAKAFWPGPLTIVVPLKSSSPIHPLVTAGLETIGLRHPRGIAGDVIAKFGKPLAAPSANRSGRLSPTTASHVAEEFAQVDRELLVLDNGASVVGLESTIVKIHDGEIYILRHGAITKEIIEQTTGIVAKEAINGKIEAPGMLASHYAPDARVVPNCVTTPNDGAWLQFGEVKQTQLPHLNLSASGNLIEAAANLYSFLKILDREKPEAIHVSPIPDLGIGIAINDRLKRAAAPRGQQPDTL